jgi:hypothetical protein
MGIRVRAGEAPPAARRLYGGRGDASWGGLVGRGAWAGRPAGLNGASGHRRAGLFTVPCPGRATGQGGGPSTAWWIGPGWHGHGATGPGRHGHGATGPGRASGRTKKSGRGLHGQL